MFKEVIYIKLSNIIIGTGNYTNVKSGNTVSVTGDDGNAWGYYGPSYKKIAPKLETYIPYSEKLKKLKEYKEIKIFKWFNFWIEEKWSGITNSC